MRPEAIIVWIRMVVADISIANLGMGHVRLIVVVASLLCVNNKEWVLLFGLRRSRVTSQRHDSCTRALSLPSRGGHTTRPVVTCYITCVTREHASAALDDRTSKHCIEMEARFTVCPKGNR